jgi:hypothetical protein
MRYEEAAIYCGIALECDPSVTETYANSGWNSCLMNRPESNGFFRQWLSTLPGERCVPGAGLASDRLNLDKITLCCVDCAYQALAADALRITLSKCDLARALFFSDRDCRVERVRLVEIDRITSSVEYSNFIMHKLPEYIETDYILIIQYDGFVLNPSAWDPEFLRYEYIGAPMHVNGGSVVGNGGFSLRSRRLLQAMQRGPGIGRYDAFLGPALEDIAICRVYRTALEQRHGIRFAPVEVAERFSAEHSSPTIANFGFHNLIHLVDLHENQFNLPEKSEDGAVNITFRAATELGMLVAHRQIELRSNKSFWTRAV